MALRTEDLPGISAQARAVLIGYSKVPLPRPTLNVFSQGKVPYSTISKAAAKVGFTALLASHDEADSAARDVADAADTSFVGRFRAVLDALASDPDVASDPSKVRSAILAYRTLDELEAETPQASTALSLEPLLMAATRALTNGLKDERLDADFTLLTREQLEVLVWLCRRAQGVTEVFRQPETIAPGDPGRTDP